MSALLATATPRHIKATHRRRWKRTTGHNEYANNNPYKYIDPDGRQTGSHIDNMGFSGDSLSSLQVGAQAEMVKGSASRATADAVGEKVSVKASGTASYGTGISAEKTLAGRSPDQVGWVPVGYGAHAALVAEIKVASIKLFDGAKESPVSFELSGDAGLVGSIGGKISLDPGGYLNIFLNLGLGFGAHADYSPTVNVNINDDARLVPKP